MASQAPARPRENQRAGSWCLTKAAQNCGFVLAFRELKGKKEFVIFGNTEEGFINLKEKRKKKICVTKGNVVLKF